jgi:hypothetical protein
MALGRGTAFKHLSAATLFNIGWSVRDPDPARFALAQAARALDAI